MTKGLEITAGVVGLVFASIVTGINVVTLCRVYRRQSFVFLKYMLWLMMLASLIQILSSCQVANILDYRLASHDHLVPFVTLSSLLVFMENASMDLLLWFVTFKYWETARQVSRLIRSHSRANNNNGNTNPASAETGAPSSKYKRKRAIDEAAA